MNVHEIIFVDYPLTNPSVAGEEIHWNIFPNPFESTLTIEFETVQAGKFSLQLIDVTGKIIRTYSTINKNEGTIHQVLNLETIAAGAYLLQFQFAGQNYYVKIMKQ